MYHLTPRLYSIHLTIGLTALPPIEAKETLAHISILQMFTKDWGFNEGWLFR